MRLFHLDYKIILDLDKIIALEGPFGQYGVADFYKIHLVSGEVWERKLYTNTTEYSELLTAWEKYCEC